MTQTQQILQELKNHFQGRVSFFLMTNNSGQYAVGVHRGSKIDIFSKQWFNSEEELNLTVAKAMLRDIEEQIAELS